MVYDCWRRMVGIIKPTKGWGSLVEPINMLPGGIGVIPLFNNLRHGQIEEFQSAIPAYEEKIAVPPKALIRRKAPMISSREWKC